MRATRTIGKRSPRMVKRRNSRYVPHDRDAPTRVPMDCTPRSLEPLARAPASKPPDLWSPINPSGRFVI